MDNAGLIRQQFPHMPQRTDRKKPSPTGVVTLIGAGVRIEGALTFHGYLRIQGDIVGDVRCDDDTVGTVVVHGAGSVCGAIAAPNVVVGGRIQGPMRATASIEILSGAQVRGDAHYRLLTIEPGAIVEGELIPSASTDAAPGRERRVLSPDEKEIQALDGALAHGRRATDRPGRGARRAAGIAVAAGIVVGAGLWWDGESGPAATVAPESAMPAFGTRPPAPGPAPSPAAADAAPVAVAAAAPVPLAEPVKADGPAPAVRTVSRIVTVTGADPAKPAGVVYVRTRDPAVLWVKPRAADGEGRRIEVAGHVSTKYPVSADELLRVAEGRGVELFYQGRKLASATIEGGYWIAFEAAGKPPAAPPSPVAAAIPPVPASGAGTAAASGE